ncbi:hypothetical protein DFH09DRAFT_1093955 [Mycena vulgaris]|nr:hypothetical protein DFH09DRAFT_1093955 [Mycena vulgaris]
MCGKRYAETEENLRESSKKQAVIKDLVIGLGRPFPKMGILIILSKFLENEGSCTGRTKHGRIEAEAAARGELLVGGVGGGTGRWGLQQQGAEWDWARTTAGERNGDDAERGGGGTGERSGDGGEGAQREWRGRAAAAWGAGAAGRGVEVGERSGDGRGGTQRQPQPGNTAAAGAGEHNGGGGVKRNDGGGVEHIDGEGMQRRRWERNDGGRVGRNDGDSGSATATGRGWDGIRQGQYRGQNGRGGVKGSAKGSRCVQRIVAGGGMAHNVIECFALWMRLARGASQGGNAGHRRRRNSDIHTACGENVVNLPLAEGSTSEEEHLLVAVDHLSLVQMRSWIEMKEHTTHAWPVKGADRNAGNADAG